MKLVIYSSVAPHLLRHLLWRLSLDLREVQVCGVLYETTRPGKPLAQRLRRILHLLRDRDFLIYVADRLRAGARDRAERLLDRALRAIHAAPPDPNGPPVTLEALAHEWSARGVPFHITGDCHDAASLSFVRNRRPDLGLVYGTRILQPALFEIPARGSLNIHKHRLPDYRGSGAPGLWELRDGRTELTVTVHRVVQDVDAGAIVGERSFPIDEFDTLDSLQYKADLVGVDLIVDVLRDEAAGRVVERVQPPGGTLFKGIAPHQKHAVLRRIRASRPKWRPSFMRPLHKRLFRTAVLPLLALRNHRRRRGRAFPVVVLYHHLTSDRSKYMGVPTAAFARQIRYLKKHYRLVSLPDAVARLRSGSVTEPTLVLTFDDGYAENFMGLRAIAEIEQVPVAVFVCPSHVDRGSELAHDVARGERGFPSMGWDEVRYLDRHGVTIGSHTRTHFDCGSQEGARLLDEIAGSRADLEAALDHPIEAFAFPKGKPHNISPQALAIARACYPVVLSAAGGTNFGPIALPAEIRRHAHPDSLLELELQIQGLLDPAVPLRPGAALDSNTIPPSDAPLTRSHPTTMS